MNRRIVMALAASATLAGCAGVSDSPLNPFNWFGRSEPAVVVTSSAADPRPLVSQVIDLRVESVPGGAIVQATGLPERQGYWDGALVPLGRETPQNGALFYEFRANPPFEATRVSTQRSREVIVGRFISEQTLAGVSSIRVSGAENALAVRR